MKRGLILVVICVTVGGFYSSVVSGKEARSSRKQTLMERFSIVRDAFTRKSSSNSSNRSNRSQKSSQQAKRRSTASVSQPSQPQQAAKVAAARPKKKSAGPRPLLPRVQPSDLLPGRMFSGQPASYNSDAEPNTITTPRVGSARLARRSPPMNRTHELESALADLLEPTAESSDNNGAVSSTLVAEIASATDQLGDTVSPIYELDDVDVAYETDQEMPPEDQPFTTAADTTEQPADVVAESSVAETENEESQVAGTEVAQSQVAELPATETSDPETPAPETQEAETQVAEAEVVEVPEIETPVAETQVTETQVAQMPVTENQSPIRLQPAESNPIADSQEVMLPQLSEESLSAIEEQPLVAESIAAIDEAPMVVAESPATLEAAEQAAPQMAAQLAAPEETPVVAVEQTLVETPEESLEETLTETSDEMLLEAPVETLADAPEDSLLVAPALPGSENLIEEAPVKAEPLLPSRSEIEELAEIQQQTISQEQLALEERIAAAAAVMAAEQAAQAQIEAAEREALQEEAIQNEALLAETPAEDLQAQEELSDSEPMMENPPVEQDVALAEDSPQPLPVVIASDVAEEQESYAMESQLSEPSQSEAVDQSAADQIAPPLALINLDPAEEDEQLLFSNEQPQIVSHVEGPRRISVGSEAIYRVTLQNNGGAAARAVKSNIRVPAWAELIGVSASQGTFHQIEQSDNSVVLQWQLPDLQAHASQTLQVKLMPEDNRALQLGVQWSYEPADAETVVEVQEPQLEMDLTGPNEAIYGKPVRYRLTLSNPGSVPAENVEVHLVPFGKSENSGSDHNFGRLLPGERKEVELELVAREVGELVMQAKAVAEGGQEIEAIKTVTCLKSEIVIDWRGPEVKYAGTPATYYFRMYNPGSISTDPVEVNLQLPNGVEVLAASEGFTRDSELGSISWQLSGLEPKEERFLEVKCSLDQPGNNELLISAKTAGGDLRQMKAVRINVIAVADLKLDVSDPQGPMAVGEDAEYLIRVRNRGNLAARGINVVALFSEGIDPTAVEGVRYSARDGRVAFQTIDSLDPGNEVVLRIRAEASQPGTHIFRTEVYCQDLDIKLAAEETTRFFLDENRWDDSNTPQSASQSEKVWR